MLIYPSTVCLARAALLAACAFLVGSCDTLRRSKPLLPIREYERLIAGRLDANYIGTARCLAACHEHDHLRLDFEGSTMGAQLSSESGLPLVDCESCHGPGSLAVEGLSVESVQTALDLGQKPSCNFGTLTQIHALPAQARSLICLKCHTGNATFALHEWVSGAHAGADVACNDCHNIHAGPDLIVHRDEMLTMCTGCHEQRLADFSLPSHHPVTEGKMVCTDCHDPHGTNAERLLKRTTLKETCTNCHGQMAGPFAFEHADLGENCLICHAAHGSVNNNLLNASEPFLCLQCHNGHWLDTGTSGQGTAVVRGTLYTRCTDCHTAIHGTDAPSPSGRGTFIR